MNRLSFASSLILSFFMVLQSFELLCHAFRHDRFYRVSAPYSPFNTKMKLDGIAKRRHHVEKRGPALPQVTEKTGFRSTPE
jgi:hypothetical protein